VIPKNPAEISLKEARVCDWLSKGAKPTLTIYHYSKQKALQSALCSKAVALFVMV
jgi:ribosomal protein S16